jgi:hypothetical protein
MATNEGFHIVDVIDQAVLCQPRILGLLHPKGISKYFQQPKTCLKLWKAASMSLFSKVCMESSCNCVLALIGMTDTLAFERVACSLDAASRP